MTRGNVLAAAAALLLPLAACGKKGPPLAPLRPVPGPVTDLAARRVGPEMQIHFTLPTQNVAPGERVNLEAVDIYAVTVEAGAVVPPAKELLTRKFLIKSIPVRPPPDPEAPAEEAEPEAQKAAAKDQKPQVKDERPLPGERVTFVETLTTAELTPAIRAKPVVVEKGAAPVVAAALDPAVVTRYYVVRGRSGRGDPGAPSGRIALPLVAEPPPPTEVKADVTETALTLSWTAPPAAIDPVAAAAHEQAWAAAIAPPTAPVPARAKPAPADPLAPSIDPAVLVPLTRLPGVQLPPTVILPAPVRFNVYAVKDGTVDGTPLNSTPLAAATFAVGEPAWNEERCFAVRTLRTYGLVSLESAATAPTCVTPVDKFPPKAPTGLKAVSAAGEMNLIWDANTDADLAGYVVLRGEAPGDTLQPLTPKPIGDTNYRDTAVQPGVRYVYAIVAVDKATPPNVSPQSNRVEEVAR